MSEENENILLQNAQYRQYNALGGDLENAENHSSDAKGANICNAFNISMIVIGSICLSICVILLAVYR